MGSGRSGNLKNGLAMPKNPYFDPSHFSLLPLGAKRVSPPPFGYPLPNLCSKYVSLLGPPPQKQTFGIIGDTFCERESLSAYQKEIRGFLVFFGGWARGGPDYVHRERAEGVVRGNK